MIHGRKTLIGVVLAGWLMAGTALAQAPMSKAEIMKMATANLDKVATKLKLSPDQVNKIKPLLEQHMGEVTTARDKYIASDKGDAAKKEAGDSLRSSRSKYSDGVKGIMNPEQFTKWQGMSKGWAKSLGLKGVGV